MQRDARDAEDDSYRRARRSSGVRTYGSAGRGAGGAAAPAGDGRSESRCTNGCVRPDAPDLVWRSSAATISRARERHRSGQARHERRRPARSGARPRGQQRVGARPARHRAASPIPLEPRRVSLLDVPYRGCAGPRSVSAGAGAAAIPAPVRRGHGRRARGAAARQPRRSLRVERRAARRSTAT